LGKGAEYNGKYYIKIDHRFIKKNIKYTGMIFDLDCHVKGMLEIDGKFTLAGCKKPEEKQVCCK
jgi:hypothetical protein